MAEHGGEFLCIDGHVAVDQQPFVKAIVNGSKQFSRDLNVNSESVLDPEGDREYWLEIHKHHLEEFKMCSNPKHLGNSWLPKTEFSTDGDTADKRDCWCLKCRKDAAFLRRVKEAERQGRKLRETAGRPKRK